MDLRRRTATLALAIGITLAGCASPATGPTPTPSFADADAAYAAAEATYRAYVDALNAVDLSDPTTFEDVFQWTTGEVNAADRETLSAYHAESLTVSGDSVVQSVTPLSLREGLDEVELAVCLDVSRVALLDSQGVSRVEANRVDVQRLSAGLMVGDSPTGLLVASIEARTDGEPCAP